MTSSAAPEGGRIARAFAAARAQGRCCLIPYITAGDPHLEGTRSIARGIARAGADLLEIGVPFSDPIADGPVNQRASERALRNGVTMRSCLDLSARLRADGVLVTDLPPEEAVDLKTALRPKGIDLIFLLSPTSSKQRVERVCREASGFIYFISRTGVTGAREDLPPGLEAQVRDARDVSSLPIAVGFGISRPEQARAIAVFADGVVVGSALVRLIEEHAASADLEERVAEVCRTLQASLRLGPAKGN